MIDKLGKAILTMFGIGYFRYAPGTAASLVTCIIFYLFWISNFPLLKGKLYIVFILLIILVYSIIITDKLSYLFKKKDPKEIVIDEFIGQSIPICLYEVAHDMPKETDQVLKFYFIMFILFRIFDIAKPFPVSYYDKNFKNSFGVIMDDVCAGLYVVLVLVLYMVIT